MRLNEEQLALWGIVTAMGSGVPENPRVAVLTVLERLMAESVEVDTRMGDKLLERASFTTGQRENVLAQIREIEEEAMSIEVNAPEIISLSEVYISFPVYYTDGDNEGEPTGKRERVQVTHIREDPDGDVDDDGDMVDATRWYIARAVRDSGEEIPETELNNMGPITSACRNEQWLTADDEDNLADCIRDRVDTIRQSKAGY